MPFLCNSQYSILAEYAETGAENAEVVNII